MFAGGDGQGRPVANALTAVRAWDLMGRLRAVESMLDEEETMRAALLGLAILTVSASAAMAADATGEWLREDGAAKIRFSACGGDALCGSLAWKRDANGAGKIGEQVFFDMKPNGAGSWAGTAFNPEDGKRYTAKMTLSGDHLTTAGCVFGGLICKSFGWTRAR
jgi:uncharacterized protein (DUF2147 family)